MDILSKRLTQHGSPFELQDSVIKGIPCKIFPHSPKTLQDVFLKATSFAQREFIVNGDTRLSFSQVLLKANVFARALQQQYGVLKGCRVALLMENSPEFPVAFIAICFAGSVAVIIHADLEKQALFKALEISGCVLVVTDQKNAGKLEAGCPTFPVVQFSNLSHSDVFQVRAAGAEPYSNLFFFESPQILNGKKDLLLDDISRPTPDEVAMISFTSGTTGTPKGVVLTHRNVTTGLMNMMLGGFLISSRAAKGRTGKKHLGSNMQPCSLLLSPFSHIGGYSQIMLMCYLGGKIVLMPKWDTYKAATLIENEEVRSLSGASPTMIIDLLRSHHSSNKLKFLTNLNIHGAALRQSFLREIADKFPDIIIGTGYGMTETCGSISTVSGNELLRNPDMIGPVVPSVDIKIIDDAGQELSREELGEICVRGAMVMKGYCTDSDNTDTILNDGWLKTGDLGHLDSDGNLYIDDRLKDIIVYGHHRISAAKLERLANEHYMVDESVIFGIPSSEKCEYIVLAFLPKNPEQTGERELNQQLSSYMKNFPYDIKTILVKSLPRTASGKVNKKELRRQVMSEL